jgi:rSAM/selenodomain-associated transferase 2
MELAFAESFEQGMKRVVVVGTDIPGLRPVHLARAFHALRCRDVVVGPARDGGYYLIGLRRPARDLFHGIPWGTGEVLKRTLDAAAASGRSVILLDPLDDVDRPEDIPVWEQEVREEGLPGEPETLSIIIPALDEADRIESALAGTWRIPCVTERIVVDGGSRDGTRERARACGAQVITCAPMRSAQMNAGARAAEGTVLLFLHADTRLPPGFEHHVREVLDRQDTVAGAFSLGIDGPFPGLRVIEGLANFRSVCMGMPYGDQAIFISAARFHGAGGFPEIPIMEDFAFMQRLRREGRIGIARASVTTSARRYDEFGFWRTTLLNQIMIIGYRVGVSPARLARWYRTGLRRRAGSERETT